METSILCVYASDRFNACLVLVSELSFMLLYLSFSKVPQRITLTSHYLCKLWAERDGEKSIMHTLIES